MLDVNHIPGMTLLIGADPELFVKHGDKHVSAHDLIPGDKHAPHPVPRGAIQVDGLAAEFNIEPTNNVRSFVANIKTVMTELERAVKKHNKEYRLDASPVAHFSKEYFDQLPSDSKRLGCEPDYNAYTGRENPIPDNNALFRTGSGHVHVGWTNGADPLNKDYFAFCTRVVSRLDVYLGLPSLTWDKDSTRRKLYGKAGAFRPKSYGLEYRVLSNKWLMDPELVSWVFRATRKCCHDMHIENNLMYNMYSNVASAVINKEDYRKSLPDQYFNKLYDYLELPDRFWRGNDGDV